MASSCTNEEKACKSVARLTCSPWGCSLGLVPARVLTTALPGRDSQGFCPSPITVVPSVGQPASPEGRLNVHLLCRRSWLYQLPGWASGPGSGIKVSYFRPGARPLDWEGLVREAGDAQPGASVSRPLAAAHPRLSQRPRISPRTGEGGSVPCPPGS